MFGGHGFGRMESERPSPWENALPPKVRIASEVFVRDEPATRGLSHAFLARVESYAPPRRLQSSV
jgi:hypothetical protein